MTIPKRALGKTGLEVSIVGLGAGLLGDARLDDRAADALVATALDLGITLFDTARSYGTSEERLGRALGSRRKDVVLATKGGYGAEGAHDWTPDAIRLGIDGALRRLATDFIDVFFLHSCPLETLEDDALLDELDRAKAAGKVRLLGYSGDEEPLAWAIASSRFDVVECSVNPFDQAALRVLVPGAAAAGLGVLAKRPLANAAWSMSDSPERGDVRVYWERAKEMNVDPAPLGWAEACVRFAAFAQGVSAALVGTTRVENLEAAAAAVAKGPLDEPIATRIDDAFRKHGMSWGGLV